jgi:hypothetical protein
LRLDSGRIRLAEDALIHLERALAPRRPLAPGTVPSSHGHAPAAVSGPETVIASVAPNEVVWLGFQAVDRALPATVRVRAEGPDPLDVTLRCPPDHFLPRLFGVGELAIHASGERVTVQLVSPEDFTRATGRAPEPIDPDAAYGGWLLP